MGSAQTTPAPESSQSSSTAGNIEHTFRLSHDFAQLHNSKDYSDVKLTVAGQTFYAHKIVLAVRSQYFRALLFGGPKESSQKEIELKDASPAVIKVLLKYIYTGRMSLADKTEKSWTKANLALDTDSVLKKVKLNKMTTDQLLNIVRPTELFSCEEILDVITAKKQAGDLT